MARRQKKRRPRGATACGRPTPRGAAALDQLDWQTFICVACGEETFIGRQRGQSLADFRQLVEWLYGDPPVCSVCSHPEQIV
jgi:hypothetical protein